MGRIIISNNDEWMSVLKESQDAAGMKLSASVSGPSALLCYHKYRMRNDNFYKEDETGDFVVVSGSLVYKGRFGVPALKELLADCKRQSMQDVRKELMGNFFVVACMAGKMTAFVDETGTYSIYYFNDEATGHYLVTNTFYHVQKCAQRPLRGLEFLEYVTIPSIFDNQSPFEGIMRLGGDEVITIAEDGFAVSQVETNAYSLTGESFEQVRDEIAATVLRHAKTAAAIPYERILFLTGGVDSRLLLAAHLAAGSDVSIGNWQGSPVDMNTKSEDAAISRRLAEVGGLSFRMFDVMHDISSDLTRPLDETYERYGEYATIYGNNRKWFEIFENGPCDYWDFGHLGEVFRDVEGIEAVYREGISLEEYYAEHLRKQCAEFRFAGAGDVTSEAFDESVLMKFLAYCQKVGMDASSLKKRDCYELYGVAMLHSETIKANMYNAVGYYTNVYSQKEVFDLSVALDPAYRKGKRLIVSMIDALQPALNEVDYFTRCRPMNYDGDGKTLSEVRSMKAKAFLKRLLNKTTFGTALLARRKERNEKAYIGEHEAVVSDYVSRINSSDIMRLMKVAIGKDSCAYLPHYGILQRSCECMDRVLAAPDVVSARRDGLDEGTIHSTSRGASCEHLQ